MMTNDEVRELELLEDSTESHNRGECTCPLCSRIRELENKAEDSWTDGI